MPSGFLVNQKRRGRGRRPLEAWRFMSEVELLEAILWEMQKLTDETTGLLVVQQENFAILMGAVVALFVVLALESWFEL